MSPETAAGRTQHAVMATASEWGRIHELADAAGMELSRYIVHRAMQPDPVPAEVLRRAVRELLVLAWIEERRMADMGLGERWQATGDAVDAWIVREAELDRLTVNGGGIMLHRKRPVGRVAADDWHTLVETDRESARRRYCVDQNAPSSMRSVAMSPRRLFAILSATDFTECCATWA